jgi:hypothetical protein
MYPKQNNNKKNIYTKKELLDSWKWGHDLLETVEHSKSSLKRKALTSEN